MSGACQRFLTAARNVARREKAWTDRACAVLDDGFGGYIVEDFNGKHVWTGSAHCRYCARAEAITHMSDTVQS